MAEESPSWVFESTRTTTNALSSREDLERENERLRAVLGYCPKCIAVLDEGGKLVAHNRAFGALFHAPPALGSFIGELLDASEDWVIEHVIQAASSGRDAAALVQLRAEEGDDRFLEFVVSTLPGADGAPVGVILAGDDRTAALLDEWDRRSVARTVAELNNTAALDLGRSVLRHELTTHIEAAMRTVAALENAPARERSALLLQAREALQLMTDILGTEVRVSGASAPALANVLTAAEQATRAVQSRPERVTIRVEVPRGIYVSLSQWALVQVLTNLLSNAVRALQESARIGLITISAEREDGSARIVVRDNGPGFEPSKFQSVFELGSTTRSDRGGQSIGLALVRSIVEGASGTLHVVSEPGVGSEIGIVLPATAPHAVAIA